ncbi:MAG TPA: WecB/TagA/CpsF family glycosyltransferase [Terriglobales bacterium]|nr:WecB/TagA/CpsF family glycosyltransferase [Terriglobales bacterium]
MPGYVAIAEVPRSQPAPPTFDVLGVRVDAVQIPEMIRRLEQWIGEVPRGRYVTLTNVHAIMEAQSRPVFKQVLNRAASVCPDGMPLVWLGRRAGHSLPRRVYGPDLLWDFCRATERQGYSHFFYGGGPGTAQRLAAELTTRFPGVRVAGCYSPPFRPLSAAEDEAIVRRINDAAPDLLWVGLGCPKQEFWMHQHAGLLRVPVMLGVGQAFDLYAGNLRQAPRWMREHGLEWLFRLCREPRRLGKRYLVYNSWFVTALCWQVLMSAAKNSPAVAFLSDSERGQ